MARVKRFKVIDQAIKKYKASTTTANTPLYKYNQFRLGNATYTVTGRGRNNNDLVVYLIPFGAVASSPAYLAQMSGRLNADTAFTNLGVSTAVLGHQTVTAAVIANAIQNSAYVPAKTIIKEGVVAGASKNSQITGVPYKPRSSPTTTFPFGRISDTDRQWTRQNAISAAATASGAKRLLTFKPERLFGA